LKIRRSNPQADRFRLQCSRVARALSVMRYVGRCPKSVRVLEGAMAPAKPPQNRRVYQWHGLRALQNALRAVDDREGWLQSLGEVGEALKTWRADVVADLGGEGAVST